MGGYLFLLFRKQDIMANTSNAISSRSDHVTKSILSPPPFEEGKKILTSSEIRKQPPPFMVTPTGSLSGSNDSISHLSPFVNNIFKYRNVAVFQNKKASIRRIHKNFIKSIDKQAKVGYTINVGATCDGCFLTVIEK